MCKSTYLIPIYTLEKKKIQSLRSIGLIAETKRIAKPEAAAKKPVARSRVFLQ